MPQQRSRAEDIHLTLWIEVICVTFSPAHSKRHSRPVPGQARDKKQLTRYTGRYKVRSAAQFGRMHGSFGAPFCSFPASYCFESFGSGEDVRVRSACPSSQSGAPCCCRVESGNGRTFWFHIVRSQINFLNFAPCVRVYTLEWKKGSSKNAACCTRRSQSVPARQSQEGENCNAFRSGFWGTLSRVQPLSAMSAREQGDSQAAQAQYSSSGHSK